MRGCGSYDVSVGPAYAKARAAYVDELAVFEPVINALVDLFSRMTSRRAELAATVHYVATQLWLANDREPVTEMDARGASVSRRSGCASTPMS